MLVLVFIYYLSMSRTYKKHKRKKTELMVREKPKQNIYCVHLKIVAKFMKEDSYHWLTVKLPLYFWECFLLLNRLLLQKQLKRLCLQ